MSVGAKETLEIVRFIVCFANFVIKNAGKSPVALVLQLGELVNLLQLVPSAITGAHKALAEALDGFTTEEKEQLYAAIDELKAPSATMEAIVESALKAAVGFSELIGALRGEKTV